MYRKWYRRQTDLSSFKIDTGHIPRVSRLTETDFIVNYDRAARPVILPDVIPFWPAASLWSPDSLALHFPDMMVKCSQLNISRNRIKMTMMEYLTYMRRSRDPNPLYIFDSGVFKRVPILRTHYKIPKFFRLDYFSVMGDRRPPYRWIVIGPAHSGTAFHVDPNGTSAWNALLSGHKRWALYPPHQTPPGLKFVQLNGKKEIDNYRGLSPLRWYYEVYPYLKPHEKPVEVTQGPGEMIYVPSGWWHMVLNLDETVSVTQNFVNDHNLKASTEVLYKAPKQKVLKLWMEKLYETHPEVFSRVKNYVKILKGKGSSGINAEYGGV
eukprot:TRINITY_DN13113_c0_g1_i3.p1 TRINITY_DN13113_c0_g1~~TRINITY_DN13113_c0_g1_i3.p1  ORF type:complete len:323 (-),score=65.21 TRINITY_DN13113_c0_g1_i3:914-1882(-)